MADEATVYQSFLDELSKIAASKHRLAVSKSRAGRRSLSVSTLLKKDNDGTLFKKSAWRDKLPGGLADSKKPTDFPSTALHKGERVECEHTSKPALATEIAMDHLAEDPSYYKKLERVEKSAGLMDILTTPIPGTKDWFIRTGKQGLQGAATTVKKLPNRMGATTRTMGGVTSIGEHELKRLGFGDLAKRAHALQGHTEFQGLPIAIENRVGSTRSGVDKDGKPWKTTFKHPYGYLKGTTGKDGEEIDVYLGPNKDAPKAHVVHQRHIDGTGHDEDKVMLGFGSKAEARAAYLDHYNTSGKKLLGPISTLTVDALKQKLDEKREHTKLASSSSGPTGNRMAMIDMDEKPDQFKAGDVPSRDGTSPGAAKIERHEAGQDFVATIPTNGAMASSSTGAMTRL